MIQERVPISVPDIEINAKKRIGRRISAGDRCGGDYVNFEGPSFTVQINNNSTTSSTVRCQAFTIKIQLEVFCGKMIQENCQTTNQNQIEFQTTKKSQPYRDDIHICMTNPGQTGIP